MGIFGESLRRPFVVSVTFKAVVLFPTPVDFNSAEEVSDILHKMYNYT
jgi:hypothetical protein